MLPKNAVCRLFLCNPSLISGTLFELPGKPIICLVEIYVFEEFLTFWLVFEDLFCVNQLKLSTVTLFATTRERFSKWFLYVSQVADLFLQENTTERVKLFTLYSGEDDELLQRYMTFTLLVGTTSISFGRSKLHCGFVFLLMFLSPVKTRFYASVRENVIIGTLHGVNKPRFKLTRSSKALPNIFL